MIKNPNTMLFQGWLSEGCDGEADYLLMLTFDGKTVVLAEHIVNQAELVQHKKTTVRYWTSAEETNIEAMQEATAKQAIGKLDALYQHRYSECTGYLWTDEELNIGGHDLIEELKGDIGKYLILEMEVH